MIDLNNATYVDFPPAMKFELVPERTALVIVDVQYANCSRSYGQGKRLAEQSREDVVKQGFEPGGLLYRYERIEKVVIPNLQRLLRFFREKEMKVVYLTLGSKMPDFSDMSPHAKGLTEWANNREGQREHEILDEIKPAEGEYVLNKVTFDAFHSSGFDTLLRSINVDQLLFGGVTTDFCVGSTARSAADKGYKCVMIEDACATMTEGWQRIWMTTFQMLYGRVATTDGILHDLEASLMSNH